MNQLCFWATSLEGPCAVGGKNCLWIACLELPSSLSVTYCFSLCFTNKIQPPLDHEIESDALRLPLHRVLSMETDSEDSHSQVSPAQMRQRWGKHTALGLRCPNPSLNQTVDTCSMLRAADVQYMHQKRPFLSSPCIHGNVSCRRVSLGPC